MLHFVVHEMSECASGFSWPARLLLLLNFDLFQQCSHDLGEPVKHGFPALVGRAMEHRVCMKGTWLAWDRLKLKVKN